MKKSKKSEAPGSKTHVWQRVVHWIFRRKSKQNCVASVENNTVKLRKKSQNKALKQRTLSCQSEPNRYTEIDIKDDYLPVAVENLEHECVFPGGEVFIRRSTDTDYVDMSLSLQIPKRYSTSSSKSHLMRPASMHVSSAFGIRNLRNKSLAAALKQSQDTFKYQDNRHQENLDRFNEFFNNAYDSLGQYYSSTVPRSVQKTKPKPITTFFVELNDELAEDLKM